MTNEQARAIICKEYLCVDRDCDIERSCGKCDLMMPSKEPILQAYKMAMDALQKLEQIEQIINAPVYIQEDVMRYKMICEVMKNDKRTSQIRVDADIWVAVRGKETGT